MTEIQPGEFRLYLVAGTTDVDGVAIELGHEPNGPFWAAITELIVETEAPGLRGRFWTDSEADAFLAHSGDRAVLDDLAGRLGAVASDANRLRELVTLAASRGNPLDD